jgi:hydroxymethylpyrimidine/phosphomethylpyrimidine kinase
MYLVCRIEAALMATDKTVQEIAYEFGFSSQAHFAKFFKKMRGIAPSSFRKSPLRLPQGGEFQQDEESFK